MNILHTSDWHIGKQLHKVDLSDDLELFFDWLLQTIKDKAIDLLLVSGDVFDQANPSQAAMTQYYGFLKRMIGSGCKILITGGNHDSAAVLNAPKDILSVLDVAVVGGATETISEVFFTYCKNNQKLVVAGVPFLKDRDIRKSVAGESYSDKIEQIRAGIKTYFSKVSPGFAFCSSPNIDNCLSGKSPICEESYRLIGFCCHRFGRVLLVDMVTDSHRSL